MSRFDTLIEKSGGDAKKKLLDRLKKNPKVRDPEALAAWIGKRKGGANSRPTEGIDDAVADFRRLTEASKKEKEALKKELDKDPDVKDPAALGAWIAKRVGGLKSKGVKKESIDEAYTDDSLLITALQNLARRFEYEDKWFYNQVLDVLDGRARADVQKVVKRQALEHLREHPGSKKYHAQIDDLLKLY